MIIPRTQAIHDLIQGKRKPFAINVASGELLAVVTSPCGRLAAYRATPKDYSQGILVWDGKQTSMGEAFK